MTDPVPSARRRVLLAVALVLAGVLGYGVGALAPFVFRPPLVLGQDAVSSPESRSARVSLEEAGGPALVVRPAVGDGRVLLVLYPGGLVRPQAYEWLGRALAAQGVQTVVPGFAADLAVLDSGRAGVLIERYAAGRPVVLAGHSLGGAMAAGWASEHPDELAGLVLMAAYPADGVRVEAPFGVLSLLAENDLVADGQRVRAGLGQLPPGSRLAEVPGAVHSFFGRYGPQSGDGTPTVSRAEAEAVIVAEMSGYLANVG
ncbi:MAG: alpha/beta fold hydrolase [Actinomycetes bacterium]